MSKVRQVFKEGETVSLNDEYTQSGDYWVISYFETYLKLTSNRYRVALYIPELMLEDYKQAEKLKKVVYNHLLFFIKGFEAGINTTKEKIKQDIEQAFTNNQTHE